MSTPHERLMKMVMGRDVEVHLAEGAEVRVRAHIDRCNQDLERLERETGEVVERFDAEGDKDLAITLMSLVDAALDASEKSAGVSGTMWGDMRSREVVDEERRRRQAGK